jgi:hypothetical protein
METPGKGLIVIMELEHIGNIGGKNIEDGRCK